MTKCKQIFKFGYLFKTNELLNYFGDKKALKEYLKNKGLKAISCHFHKKGIDCSDNNKSVYTLIYFKKANQALKKLAKGGAFDYFFHGDLNVLINQGKLNPEYTGLIGVFVEKEVDWKHLPAKVYTSKNSKGRNCKQILEDELSELPLDEKGKQKVLKKLKAELNK